jgi:hypothetical protein
MHAHILERAGTAALFHRRGEGRAGDTSGRGKLVSSLISSKRSSVRMVGVYQLNSSIEIGHQYTLSPIDGMDNVNSRTSTLTM